MTLLLVGAREAFAAALTEIDGLNVRPRPPVKIVKPGDGWVNVSQIKPSDYARCDVTLTAVISLGADVAASEDLLNTLAIPAIDAVTVIDEMPVADVVAEPIIFPADDGAGLNGLSITLTTEVEA